MITFLNCFIFPFSRGIKTNNENNTIDKHIVNMIKDSTNDIEKTKIKVIMDYELDEHFYKSRNAPASDAILKFI